MHGINKIYTGNYAEKIVWSVCVLVAITFAVIISKGFVENFLKREVYQVISSTTTNRAYFPQVTFCLDNLRSEIETLSCGVSVHKINSNTHCESEKLDCDVPMRKIKGMWSNGIFSVPYFENVQLKDLCKERCLDKMLNDHKEIKGVCLTWHFNKTFFQLYSTTAYSVFEIRLLVSEDLVPFDKDVSVIIADQNVSGIFHRSQLQLFPGLRYKLKLSKTVTIRKQKPFTSKCTFKTKKHLFPGLYNRRTCLRVYKDIEMLKKYGITRDITRSFIPKEIKEKYKQIFRHNLSTLRSAYSSLLFDSMDFENPNCPLACYE